MKMDRALPRVACSPRELWQIECNRHKSAQSLHAGLAGKGVDKSPIRHQDRKMWV